MSLSLIILIVLVLLLVGALPTWGHSSKWGYGPSGGLGRVVVIVLVLLLMGRISSRPGRWGWVLVLQTSTQFTFNVSPKPDFVDTPNLGGAWQIQMTTISR